MDGKSCGSCALCCKLMEVPELDKPAGRWCRHCRPGNECSIYNDNGRPDVCRSYGCMWLSSDLPERWQPSRCKFVVTHKPSLHRMQVMVDPAYPDAWRKEAFLSQFRLWARGGTIVSVFVGDRVTHMLPNGEEREDKKMSLETALEHLQKRRRAPDNGPAPPGT